MVSIRQRLARAVAAVACASSSKDATRTLASLPRRLNVIETVREQFPCHDCDKIIQGPAPFHSIARRWATGAKVLNATW